jgi:NADH-quinone oxidoreductase subunit B
MSEKNLTNINQKVERLEGYEGPGFLATTLDKAVGLARKNSLWPLPFATSCCGIEFMATMASHYDLARFGSERLSFSPRQADMLMVMGTIAKKMGPVLRQVYEQMAEPKWVLSVGACASSVEYLTPTAFYRVLTELFLLMFMCRDAHHAPNKFWKV